MKSLQKASFTIEMALIMPVILLVVFSGIYLMAHVRNRAFLTASACEQAVSGHDPETPALFAAVDPARRKKTVKSVGRFPLRPVPFIFQDRRYGT